MPQIKIATWNVEWMFSLFGARWQDWDGSIPDSFPGKSLGSIRLEPIEDVPALCERIAGVIKKVKAKVIGYQEGPPLKEQMELFVERFLDGEYAVHHSNPQSQTVGALVHESIAARVSAWLPELPDIETAWKNIPYYPWGLIGAADRKKHRLARHPLLLRFAPTASKALGVMVLHTKSKYSKLKRKEQWESRDREAVLDALTARAKLSAEVFRVREFLDQQFDAPTGLKSVVVTGDLNDGPFAELMEKEFLIHNIVDELVGTLLSPDYHLRHAMTPDALRTAATTRFPDPLQDGQIVEELIDHVLVSPAIWQGAGAFRVKANSCQVEAQAYEQFNEDAGEVRRRGLRPSDHKPVSVVLEY